jgi:hypothetical protein
MDGLTGSVIVSLNETVDDIELIHPQLSARPNDLFGSCLPVGPERRHSPQAGENR